jgi:ATP/maltotriose-dependent transcriptional regulator MalT
MLASAACHGPEPVPRAIRRCERLLALAGDDAITRRYVVVSLARLFAMRGTFGRARTLLREASDFDETLRSPQADDVMRAAAELATLMGKLDDAEMLLRELGQRFEARGAETWVATFNAALAEVLCLQGRSDEALALADQAAVLAHRDDVLVHGVWRRARARTAARRGDLAVALTLVREANELFETTDELNERAATRLAGAEVLVLAARHDEAATAAGEGLALLRRKGNTAGIRRARAQLAAIGIGAIEGEEPVGASPSASG